MKSSFLNQLINGKKKVAVLIDPEKFNVNQSDEFMRKLRFSNIQFVFIGGSTVQPEQFRTVSKFIKAHLNIPIIGFPGDVYQYDKSLDGLLYLSLLSGRNPDFLIGRHVLTSKEIFRLGIDIIPTAYLLVDGGKLSTTAYVSQTQAMPQENIDLILRTVMAGMLQGKQVAYLDAGSGAKFPIHTDIVKEIRKENIPLIVGGGIRSIEQIEQLHKAGANLVVIGNHVEENDDFLLDLNGYLNASPQQNSCPNP